MKARLDYANASPSSYKAMIALETAVRSSGLDSHLLHLIKLRASQINGCAYCVDLHNKEALRDGETQQRLNLLCVWQESPLYTDKERAALEWTESLTLISENHVPDEVFERVRLQFTEEEMVKLTLAVNGINAWNRISIAFRNQHPIDKPAAA